MFSLMFANTKYLVSGHSSELVISECQSSLQKPRFECLSYKCFLSLTTISYGCAVSSVSRVID